MTVMQDELNTPEIGAGIGGVQIRVVLLSPTESDEGLITGSDLTIVDGAITTTDANGAFSIDLPATSTITPAGSRYRAIGRARQGNRTVYDQVFSVPDSGPAWIADHLDDAPTALTQALNVDFLGPWQTGQNYTKSQGVSHNGASYVALSDHLSAAATEPGVGASWETVWFLLAAKGEAGTANATVYTKAGLPSGAHGDLAAVSDDVRGLWLRAADQWVKNAPHVNVRDFGAVGDGVADDATAIQAAIDSMSTTGGVLYFPPGTYLVSVAPTLNAKVTYLVSSYGAEIKTTGAIYAFALKNVGSTMFPPTVEGLKINQTGNTTAIGGFLIEKSWNVRLRDCTIQADGANSANYNGAIVLQNGTAGDVDTGSFWCHIENVWIRKNQGTDTGTIPVGVRAWGSPNALRITGGGINNCDDGVLIEKQPGGEATLISNAYVIEGVAFEGNTTGVRLDGDGADSGGGSGLRIIGCRGENLTNFFEITNRTFDYAVPPYLAGNHMVSSVTNHIVKPAAIKVTVLDSSITPSIGMNIHQTLTITQPTGSEHCLVLDALATSQRGLRLRLKGGITLFDAIAMQSGGTDFTQVGSAAGGLPRTGVLGVRGLSRTSVHAVNFRNSVTISDAATTGSVTFPTAEADTSYFVTLGARVGSGSPPTAALQAWTTNKATTGFTVNLGAAPGAGNSVVVDWILVR